MNDRFFRRALLLLAALLPCLVMSQSVLAQEDPPEEEPPYEFFIQDYTDIQVQPGANGTLLYVNLMASFWTNNEWFADLDINWGATVYLDGQLLVGTEYWEGDVSWDPDAAMSRNEDAPSIIVGSAVVPLSSGHHVVEVHINAQGVPAYLTHTGFNYTQVYDVP